MLCLLKLYHLDIRLKENGVIKGHLLLTETCLYWIAGVFTPHDFEVDSTDWAVTQEHGIEGLEVGLEHSSRIITTAQGRGRIEEGACCCQVRDGCTICNGRWCVSIWSWRQHIHRIGTRCISSFLLGRPCTFLTQDASILSDCGLNATQNQNRDNICFHLI